MNKGHLVIMTVTVLAASGSAFLSYRMSSLEKRVSLAAGDLLSEISEIRSMTERLSDETGAHEKAREERFLKAEESLSRIEGKVSSQFSQTLGMKKTYDELLSEQKKRTVDTAGKDMQAEEAKKEGLMLYAEKKYGEAYVKLSTSLLSHEGDWECRLYRAKSLYLSNPLESSSYPKILRDIKILRENGFSDNELSAIEKNILMETGGTGYDE